MRDIVVLLCLADTQDMSSLIVPPHPAFEVNNMLTLAMLVFAFVPGVQLTWYHDTF